jgi:16S rRNA (guanine527-N7)-methyltransferase
VARQRLTVSRETLAELARPYELPPGAPDRFARLLGALEAEPDPPTTVREAPEALDAHIADSLSGLEERRLRRAGRIADVGSGAGFPGLVLAVALPGASVDLVESARRKCDVIERLAAAAGLSNAQAVVARAEDWGAGEGAGAYDAVTARALASLPVLVEYAAPLLRVGGVLVAWKGARDAAEESAGSAAAGQIGMSTEGVRAVTPFVGARNRHLHVFRKVAETPAGFPRRSGMAAKRPLG